MSVPQNVLVELEFTSPVFFQRSWHERPWRIPSDYIVRALVYSYALLHNEPKEFLDTINKDLIRISSLLIFHKNNLYVPISGIRGYRPIDGSDVIDSMDIMGTISKVRIPRIEEAEPTPYEEYVLETSKYKWGLIISSMDNKLTEKILPTLKVLGDLGIGAKKTKGGGRFDLLSVRPLKDFNLDVHWNGSGILISRYIPSVSKNLPTKIKTLYQERVQIRYSEKIVYEFMSIAEGSELEIADTGKVEIVKNDLEYDTPLYFRPLLLSYET
ncbi:MAG: hypothetical protein WED07_00160 [Candidatus Freyarchaeum deiterrae]